MKTYKLTAWGKTYDVQIRKSRYTENKNLALIVDYFDEDYQGWMPYANMTVNLGPLSDGFAYVDANNCPWAEELIAVSGIGTPVGAWKASGWCMYPLYQFDVDSIEEVA